MTDEPIISRVKQSQCKVYARYGSSSTFRSRTRRLYHGRTAAAPVFFVADGDDDGLCDCTGMSTMGRLAAFLSAFHLSQAGVPAASMRSVKIVDDHLPSIAKVFFDPSSKERSAPSGNDWCQKNPTELHEQTGLPSVRLGLRDSVHLDCYCRVGILNPR